MSDPSGSISEDAKAKLAAALGGSVGATAENPTAAGAGQSKASEAGGSKDSAGDTDKAGVVPALARIIEAATGLPLEEITPQARLEDDLNIDSLSMIDIITLAEDRFGVRIEESEVRETMSVSEFADLIEALQQGK